MGVAHGEPGPWPRGADGTGRQRSARSAASTQAKPKANSPPTRSERACADAPRRMHPALPHVRISPYRGTTMTMSDVKATLSFSDGSPSMELPIYRGLRRAGRDRHPQALRADRQVHFRPRFPVHGSRATRASPTSMATRASCCIAATRSSSSPCTCDFLETCYLLLYGDLPNAQEKKDFVHVVTNHTMVNEQMQFFLRGFRRDAHPMAVMTGPGRRVVGLLSRQHRHQRTRSTARSPRSG